MYFSREQLLSWTLSFLGLSSARGKEEASGSACASVLCSGAGRPFVTSRHVERTDDRRADRVDVVLCALSDVAYLDRHGWKYDH